jgi:peroxiredoxin
MRLKQLLIILLVLPQALFSQNVILRGNVPEYAGEELTFSTYSDYITFTEVELCTAVVDANGNFECSFTSDKTNYVFVKLGVYEAFIFAEPNKEYELLFPERKDKTIADELNPYFAPTQYHLGISNILEDDLNYHLAFFDEIYSKLINETLYSTYNELKERNANSKLNKVDTVFSKRAYSRAINNNTYFIYNNLKDIDAQLEFNKIDSIFSDVDNKFFHDFKKYKLALFLYSSNREKSKSISNTYYLDNEVLYRNPSYMSLFNQVYQDYFTYFGRTDSGKKIYNDINNLRSYTSLCQTLRQDSILKNDTLKELVILKCLYDEFYKDKFSRKGLLSILDTLEISTEIEEHKLIAKNIREKATKLLVGFKPPYFELYDKDSNLISLDTYKGKYIYLGFCTTMSYGCIKEFKMLEKLYEKHKDHFEIVMICLDETLDQMKFYVENEGYSYTFLHYGNQSEVFKDYDIRAFPTYYFINPDGKLSISPAPSPDQNAEFVIFKKMRANGDI